MKKIRFALLLSLISILIACTNYEYAEIRVTNSLNEEVIFGMSNEDGYFKISNEKIGSGQSRKFSVPEGDYKYSAKGMWNYITGKTTIRSGQKNELTIKE